MNSDRFLSLFVYNYKKVLMKKIIIMSVTFIALLFIILNVFGKPDSIKIGLVAGLSGKYSLLGIDVKDGAILAFSEVDYKINDINIELIQKDDKQNEDENKKVINELINNDVKIIIGNGTSSMSKVSLDLINKYDDVLLFSPTAASDFFSGKDDNFIRLQVSNNPVRFENLAKYFLRKNLKNIIAIYDTNNLLYSKGYISDIEKAFVTAGGKKIIENISVSTPLETITQRINKKNVDVVLLSTNTSDTARIIQYLKVNNIDKAILCSDWTKGPSFIEEGGKAVEGSFFYTSYDNQSKNKEYLKFVERFNKEYKRNPSLFAFQSYETAKILISTLKKDNDISNIKRNILNKSKFDLLQGNVIFDKYGDVKRDQFMVIVKDGQYIRLDDGK